MRRLLDRYGIELCVVADGAPIPGSFWGEPEAGVDALKVCARRDTPVHSMLHEAAHIVCMSPERRASLFRDAGGDDLEESAVCYLQIRLAADIDGYSSARVMRDMDAWGYSFRLGAARAWFERDAEDAEAWLLARGLIDETGRPSYRLRSTAD